MRPPGSPRRAAARRPARACQSSAASASSAPAVIHGARVFSHASGEVMSPSLARYSSASRGHSRRSSAWIVDRLLQQVAVVRGVAPVERRGRAVVHRDDRRVVGREPVPLGVHRGELRLRVLLRELAHRSQLADRREPGGDQLREAPGDLGAVALPLRGGFVRRTGGKASGSACSWASVNCLRKALTSASFARQLPCRRVGPAQHVLAAPGAGARRWSTASRRGA